MESGRSERLLALAKQLKGSSAAAQIRSQTYPYRTTPCSDRSCKRAAVLVCVFESEDGDLRVLLTKRSSTLSTHSGEVSLPGGKWEEGDADDIQTALMEAKEEIVLDPSLVHVVAVLQPFTNKIGIRVVPVIGLLYDKGAYVPAANPVEVEVIFDVSLEMMRIGVERIGNGWETSTCRITSNTNRQMVGRKYVIWALTAGILITAASLVYQRPPDFLERKPGFWNTTKLQEMTVSCSLHDG